ncbi:MAG TPA: sigma factor, partial [Thermodesulfobacteriota bacterium]
MGRPPREHVLSDDPDLPLVQRAGRGDQAACAVLVDRHLPAVLRVAERLLGERAAAEDVAQEAFLRVWQGAGR